MCELARWKQLSSRELRLTLGWREDARASLWNDCSDSATPFPRTDLSTREQSDLTPMTGVFLLTASEALLRTTSFSERVASNPNPASRRDATRLSSLTLIHHHHHQPSDQQNPSSSLTTLDQHIIHNSSSFEQLYVSYQTIPISFHTSRRNSLETT